MLVTLHQSGLNDRVEAKASLEFVKEHFKIPEGVRKKILWSDEAKLNIGKIKHRTPITMHLVIWLISALW